MSLGAPAGMYSARFASIRRGGSDAVGAQVRRILALTESSQVADERRQAPRTPFPHLVRVQAIDPQTLAAQDEPLVVVGRYLSEQGFGFYHNTPLAHRFVAVTLESPGGDAVRLLLDLSWCRFTQLGWYESGGRFLRVID